MSLLSKQCMCNYNYLTKKHNSLNTCHKSNRSSHFPTLLFLPSYPFAFPFCHFSLLFYCLLILLSLFFPTPYPYTMSYPNTPPLSFPLLFPWFNLLPLLLFPIHCLPEIRLTFPTSSTFRISSLPFSSLHFSFSHIPDLHKVFLINRDWLSEWERPV